MCRRAGAGALKNGSSGEGTAQKLVIQEQTSLRESRNEAIGGDCHPVAEQHLLGGFFAGPRDLGEAQSIGCFQDLLFSKFWSWEPAKASLNRFPDLRWIGESELNQVIKATIKGLVEPITVVGSGNDEAIATELFDEDQESVQKTPHFADIACEVPGVADAVKLVEQVDGPGPVDRLENHAKLRERFAKIAGDEAVESNNKQGQREFVGQSGGGHGLSASRWAGEEKSLTRLEPMFFEAGEIPLFFEDSSNPCRQRGWEDQVARLPSGIYLLEQLGRLTLGLGDMEDRSDRFWLRLLLLRLIDEILDLQSDVLVAASGFGGGELQRDGVKPLVVTCAVTLKESFDLCGCGHRIRYEVSLWNRSIGASPRTGQSEAGCEEMQWEFRFDSYQ